MRYFCPFELCPTCFVLCRLAEIAHRAHHKRKSVRRRCCRMEAISTFLVFDSAYIKYFRRELDVGTAVGGPCLVVCIGIESQTGNAEPPDCHHDTGTHRRETSCYRWDEPTGCANKRKAANEAVPCVVIDPLVLSTFWASGRRSGRLFWPGKRKES